MWGCLTGRSMSSLISERSWSESESNHMVRGCVKGSGMEKRRCRWRTALPFEPLQEPTEFLWVINFKRHWCIQKKTPRAFLFIIGTWIISTIIVLQQGLGNCCNTSKNYDSTLKSSRGLPMDHSYPTCPIPERLQLLFPKKPCALQSCHPQYTPVSAVLIRRTLSKVDFT